MLAFLKIEGPGFVVNERVGAVINIIFGVRSTQKETDMRLAGLGANTSTPARCQHDSASSTAAWPLGDGRFRSTNGYDAASATAPAAAVDLFTPIDNGSGGSLPVPGRGQQPSKAG